MKSTLLLTLAFGICHEVISSYNESDPAATRKLNASRRSDDIGYPSGDSHISESYQFPEAQQAAQPKQIFLNQGYGNAVLGYEPLNLATGLRSVSPERSSHQVLSPSYDIHNKDQESQSSAVIYSDAPGIGNNGPATNYGGGRYFGVGQVDSSRKNQVSIKKKYGKGGSISSGGWDLQSSGFNSAGPWYGGGSSYQGAGLGGSGLAGAAGLLAVKKATGAKALFVLIVPLILLAVFGPILAGQAMLPWAVGGAGGGISSVATTAVAGGRRRRSIPGHLPENSSLDPRQVAELEKRLRVFMAVQEYIAQTGSEYSFQDDVSAAYMKCQGYLEDNNQCIERVACEYADKKSAMNGIERRITGMVLQNIMSNRNLPASIKGRLSKGAMFGRTHSNRCASYFCEIVDGKRRHSQNLKP